ncbi:MAG: hypothetical protein AB7E55_10850 [Pigmentiphaga sp.]
MMTHTPNPADRPEVPMPPAPDGTPPTPGRTPIDPVPHPPTRPDGPPPVGDPVPGTGTPDPGPEVPSPPGTSAGPPGNPSIDTFPEPSRPAGGVDPGMTARPNTAPRHPAPNPGGQDRSG